MTVATKTMAPYNHVISPSDPASAPRHLEEELRKIEKTLKDVEAAVVQLQKTVLAASAFPILMV